MARLALQTAMRAAAVTMLEAYKSSASLSLQIYRARPRSLHLPCAFVDGIRETFPDAGQLLQRVPTADVIVIFGLFDSGEAVDQKDAFADGFSDYVFDDFHAAGANTGIVVRSMEDIPDYVNDWMPPAEQRTYYAVRISLEGLYLTG